MRLRKTVVAILAEVFGHIAKTDTALLFYRKRWLSDHSLFTRAEPVVYVVSGYKSMACLISILLRLA